MTPEEKQLLIKILCGMLPYGVKVNFRSNIEVLCEVHIYQSVQTVVGESGILYDVDMPNVKPYLRSISNMTEEERKEMGEFIFVHHHEWDGTDTSTSYIEKENIEKYFDWLNAHHFDYRGLIEKGLALEAPEGMYD